MTTPPTTTGSELILVAADVLTRGGYRRIEGRFPEWDTPTSRLFEDKFNVWRLQFSLRAPNLLSLGPTSKVRSLI